MKKKQRGFTLIELVVVIAVLGILVSIAIPRFLNAQATAKGAKVLSNLRSIDSAVEVYSAKIGRIPNNLEDITTDDPDNNKYKIIDALQASEGGTFIITSRKGKETAYNDVPSGTEYSIENGRGTLGGALRNVDWYLEGGGTMETNMAAIIATLKEQSTSTIDSEAQQFEGSYAYNAVQVFQELGIDMKAMGATIWHFQKNNPTVLKWSTVDLSTVQSGDYIPIIQYRTDSQHYTVWLGKVILGTSQINGEDRQYLRLTGATKYGVQNPNVADQTFAKAMEVYDNLPK